MIYETLRFTNCFSGSKTGWHVFYHFVGAVPGSTELLPMLQRLLKEIGAVTVSAYIISV
jgi:hypothetical protein